VRKHSPLSNESGEVDYNQNGLVLMKNPKNLKLLLRDVHQKGFLDLELLYQLKEKEKVKGIEREIADRIENPLEEGGVPPIFVPGAMRDLVVLLGFQRCLAELRP
jgi:hypothetical protein